MASSVATYLTRVSRLGITISPDLGRLMTDLWKMGFLIRRKGERHRERERITSLRRVEKDKINQVQIWRTREKRRGL